MSKRNDGGAAFPRETTVDGKRVFVGAGGMSLRDWFAGQALAGMSERDSQLAHASIQGKEHGVPHALANMAYETADAMLIARDA
jgi:hypothetical protein